MFEHKHLIIRAEVSNCPSKNNLDEVLGWMKILTSTIDMKVMFGPTLHMLTKKVYRGIHVMAS